MKERYLLVLVCGIG